MINSFQNYSGICLVIQNISRKSGLIYLGQLLGTLACLSPGTTSYYHFNIHLPVPACIGSHVLRLYLLCVNFFCHTFVYILCILYCAFCIVFLNVSVVLNSVLLCLYRLLQCRVAATPKSTRISHWDPKEQVCLRKCILAIIHKISGKNSCPGLPWPRKFSRLPRPTPARPENALSLTVAPPRLEAKTQYPVHPC